jgi:phenylacetate-CoA ligase
MKGTMFGRALYTRIPALRSVLASARGLYLRNMRYCSATDLLVEQALERDRWDAVQWTAWRGDRLPEVLHRAATQVPYYREFWSERRRRGDRRSWDVLANWPILTASEARRHRKALRPEGRRTGSRGWYALTEARWRVWNGVTRQDRWAEIGEEVVIPAGQQQGPWAVFNRALNQLALSPFHLSSRTAEAYLDAIAEARVKTLWGHSSALHTLAAFAVRHQRVLPLKAVIAQGEPLELFQRRTLEKAFAAPVREAFEAAHRAAGASECSWGKLHAWPDAAHYEVSELGELICTGLLEDSEVALVRYQTGERVRMDETARVCECGRGLPAIELSGEGRRDMLVGEQNQRIAGAAIEALLGWDLPVEQVRFAQDSTRRIQVSYEPVEGFRMIVLSEIERRLRERVGNLEICFEAVPHAERNRSIRFAASSRLSSELAIEKRR